MWGYFYSVPLIYLSILSLIQHCPDYYRFIVCLEIGQCQSSKFVLLLQYYVIYSGYFAFQKLQDQFFNTHKITCWNLGLQVKLEITDILTILSLPIHEHGLSFHLFISSLIFFIRIWTFNKDLVLILLNLYLSTFSFYLAHYLQLCANVNGIIFLISNSKYSSLIYRKANFITLTCYNHFLVRRVFQLFLWIFLYRQISVICEQRQFSIFLFKLYTFKSFFLVLWHQLECLVRC